VCEPVELIDQPVAGDGSFDQAAEAFGGVLIDDGDNLDRPAIGGGVELEVDRPPGSAHQRHRLSGGWSVLTGVALIQAANTPWWPGVAGMSSAHSS
jgi:hypothetical protein